MRKILFLILLLLSILYTKAKISSNEIGTWKAYMSYHDVTDVVRANKTLYVLASNSLYSYNENDKSITTYDKARGLSDCEINKIAWNNVVKRLIIIYKNGNIDLLDSNDDILNINDILNYTTTDNKNINDIFIYGKYAYLSTGFGVIKINMADAEISDTYRLGFNVDWIDISNNDIHVYSRDKGHFKASMSINLLDKNNWNRVGDYVAQTKENKEELFEIAKTLNPGGPKYNYFGFMKFYNGKLYTCGGLMTSDRPGTIQVLDNNDWNIYQDGDAITNQTKLTYQTLFCLDIDPTNEKHLFAGGRNGLYEFYDGKFHKFYNNDVEGCPIGSAIDDGNKEYELITGVRFDNNNNLWIFNSQSLTSSLTAYNNGKWNKVELQNLMTFGKRSLAWAEDIMFDSKGTMWFVNNNWTGPALYSYQPSSNTLNVYNDITNEDGIKQHLTNVRCVAEDKRNNIWIGTDQGPLYLETSEFSSSIPIFQQYKVSRNDGTNLADYLLAGIDVTCMCIDGGGRKWFGTNGNGVYLISEDNNTQIHHFLTSNSNLLNNTIESISINPTTGEVFFGTSSGLCSYNSNTTEAIEEMNDGVTYAYPNPVRPEYTGPITITGLTYNADIKIVTVNGTLVNKGRSTGGSYIWDGKDMNGKRVASGVYMVQTATQTGEKGTVCKIAIIN